MKNKQIDTIYNYLRKSNFYEKDTDNIEILFDKIKTNLLNLKFDFKSLFASFTTICSIYYIITPLDSDYEFRFSGFYDSVDEIFDEKVDDMEDMEGVLFIYKSHEKLISHCGKIDYLFNIIDTIINNKNI